MTNYLYSQEREDLKEAIEVIKGLLVEWDKFTRCGSPIAKSANERINYAKAFIEKIK